MKILLLIFASYFTVATIGLKYFLSDLVFLKIPRASTHESAIHSVQYEGDEVLIREYISDTNGFCVVYFPGQHGGIPKYEKEVFQAIQAHGISIYAISYPGYEGALGKSTYDSVMTTTKMAIEFIDDKTNCVITDSVFVGRSLGSAIAMQNAIEAQPKGLLLVSASPSLVPVVRAKMANNYLLKPATILPIEKILEFDTNMVDISEAINHIPIVIMQGENDTLTTYDNIQKFAKNHSNVELIKIMNATHSTVHVDAGQLYFDKLIQLLAGIESNKQHQLTPALTRFHN